MPDAPVLFVGAVKRGPERRGRIWLEHKIEPALARLAEMRCLVEHLGLRRDDRFAREYLGHIHQSHPQLIAKRIVLVHPLQAQQRIGIVRSLLVLVENVPRRDLRNDLAHAAVEVVLQLPRLVGREEAADDDSPAAIKIAPGPSVILDSNMMFFRNDSL